MSIGSIGGRSIFMLRITAVDSLRAFQGSECILNVFVNALCQSVSKWFNLRLDTYFSTLFGSLCINSKR